VLPERYSFGALVRCLINIDEFFTALGSMGNVEEWGGRWVSWIVIVVVFIVWYLLFGRICVAVWQVCMHA
jgi:Na+-driven multidrug efflux pump